MLDPLRRRLPGAWARTPDGALGGQLLLGACGVIVTATAPVLGAGQQQGLPLLAVSGVMLFVLVASTLLPWQRWSPYALLAHPAAVVLALGQIGAGDPQLSTAYVGMYVLCFMYTGVFLPRRAGLMLLPVAVWTYTRVLLPWDGVDLVRTAVMASVWVLLTQVLAALTARQRHVVADLLDDVTTDPLTRVGNRRGLDQRMLTAEPGDLVVMCDLDHFKRVNDTLGHARGDLVLRDFGRVLHDQLRGRDYAARFGGEEFLLHLVATAPVEGALMLQRLHVIWSDLHPGVTFSTGASSCGRGGPAPAVDAADRALYLAKERGRDRDEYLDAAAPTEITLPTAPMGRNSRRG